MARAPIPEKTFPRGGKKQRQWKHKDADFSIFKSKKNAAFKKYKKSKERKSKEDYVDVVTDKLVVNDLNAKDVKSGLVVLGCVERITDISVYLSLPGCLLAEVSATNLNNQYMELIKNQKDVPELRDLINIGEEYPVAILDKVPESFSKWTASLCPSAVNKAINSRYLQRGMVLSGGIVSVEEHGYVVDIGLSKVKAFLNNKNVPDGVSYRCGKQLRVQIEKLSEDHRTVQLSVFQKGNDGAVRELTADLPIHCFIPGLQFQLMVNQSTKNGVEVFLKGFGPDVKGYVHVNYLEKLFDKARNYEEGHELTGTLMYVLPIVNKSFFKVSNVESPSSWSIPYGSLVKNVQVCNLSKKGLIGKVKIESKTVKCFIPINKMNEYERFLKKETSLKDFYPSGRVLERVRIEWPSRLSRLYAAAIDNASLNEKYYTKRDLKMGKIMKCRMLVVGERYCTVEISSKLKGFVSKNHMTDQPGVNYLTKFKRGQLVRGRVLSLGDDGELARLTLKPSLVEAREILTGPGPSVEVGNVYVGVVIRVVVSSIFLEFFDGFISEIPRKRAAVPNGISLKSCYRTGQVVTCCVISKTDSEVCLSVGDESVMAQNFLKLGQLYEATVARVDEGKGLYLDVKLSPEQTYPGLLPKEMLCDIAGVAEELLKTYEVDDVLSVYCVHISPDNVANPSLFTQHRSIVEFLKGHESTDDIKQGSVIPLVCVGKNGSKLLPVCSSPANFHCKILQHSLLLRRNHFVLGKVLNNIQKKSGITCSLDVWDKKFMSSLEALAKLFDEIDELQLRLKELGKSSLAQVELGQTVKGKVVPNKNSADTELGHPVTLRKLTGVQARCLNFSSSEEVSVTGKVIWIDYSKQLIWVHPSAEKEKDETLPEVHARVVFVCQDVVVAEDVSSHQLVFIPTRRHHNDIFLPPIPPAYKLQETTRLRVYRIGNRNFGIDREIARRCERRLLKSKTELPKKLNKKSASVADSSDDVLVDYVKKGVTCTGSEVHIDTRSGVKEEIVSDEEPAQVKNIFDEDNEDDMEIKSECDSELGMQLVNEDDLGDDENETSTAFKKPVEVDTGFNWAVAENPNLFKGLFVKADDEDSSSDDDEAEAGTEKKKQKRLTGIEKREKARETEEKLRRREEQLVDSSRPPQSPDDFDRLLMASPNNSSIWLQYMAHHLENTEIEKARAVAQRALKTMSFREEQEKLNVWFGLLNLEQLYGSSESQKQVLDEALKCNEPFNVHVHKLNLLADHGAGLEAERLGNLMLKKYGQDEAVWLAVGQALMKLGKLDQARSIFQRAMSSLPTAKHVSLISRFAQLENKYGNNDRAQTLYEHVLTAFPKRIDVWSAYVDLLVKSSQANLARQVLERATSQTLPLKKMKRMFKKWLSFEEVHGDSNSAEKVRQAARDYLNSVAPEEENEF